MDAVSLRPFLSCVRATEIGCSYTRCHSNWTRFAQQKENREQDPLQQRSAHSRCQRLLASLASESNDLLHRWLSREDGLSSSVSDSGAVRAHTSHSHPFQPIAERGQFIPANHAAATLIGYWEWFSRVDSRRERHHPIRRNATHQLERPRSFSNSSKDGHPSSESQQQPQATMAKSMRSKIKRKFRTELRKKIGVPHLQIQEAKIQENLKKALESQGTERHPAASDSLSCDALLD